MAHVHTLVIALLRKLLPLPLPAGDERSTAGTKTIEVCASVNETKGLPIAGLGIG